MIRITYAGDSESPIREVGDKGTINHKLTFIKCIRYLKNYKYEDLLRKYNVSPKDLFFMKSDRKYAELMRTHEVSINEYETGTLIDSSKVREDGSIGDAKIHFPEYFHFIFEKGSSLLMFAILYDNEKAFLSLLKVYEEYVNGWADDDKMKGIKKEDSILSHLQRDEKGFTALHISAMIGRLQYALKLMKLEARAVDESGETALIKAIKGGYIEIIQSLLPLEYDIVSKNNYSAEMWAATRIQDTVKEFQKYYMSHDVEKDPQKSKKTKTIPEPENKLQQAYSLSNAITSRNTPINNNGLIANKKQSKLATGQNYKLISSDTSSSISENILPVVQDEEDTPDVIDDIPDISNNSDENYMLNLKEMLYPMADFQAITSVDNNMVIIKGRKKLDDDSSSIDQTSVSSSAAPSNINTTPLRLSQLDGKDYPLYGKKLSKLIEHEGRMFSFTITEDEIMSEEVSGNILNTKSRTEFNDSPEKGPYDASASEVASITNEFNNNSDDDDDDDDENNEVDNDVKKENPIKTKLQLPANQNLAVPDDKTHSTTSSSISTAIATNNNNQYENCPSDLTGVVKDSSNKESEIDSQDANGMTKEQDIKKSEEEAQKENDALTAEKLANQKKFFFIERGLEANSVDFSIFTLVLHFCIGKNSCKSAKEIASRGGPTTLMILSTSPYFSVSQTILQLADDYEKALKNAEKIDSDIMKKKKVFYDYTQLNINYVITKAGQTPHNITPEDFADNINNKKVSVPGNNVEKLDLDKNNKSNEISKRAEDEKEKNVIKELEQILFSLQNAIENIDDNEDNREKGEGDKIVSPRPTAETLPFMKIHLEIQLKYNLITLNKLIVTQSNVVSSNGTFALKQAILSENKFITRRLFFVEGGVIDPENSDNILIITFKKGSSEMVKTVLNILLAGNNTKNEAGFEPWWMAIPYTSAEIQEMRGGKNATPFTSTTLDINSLNSLGRNALSYAIEREKTETKPCNYIEQTQKAIEQKL